MYARRILCTNSYVCSQAILQPSQAVTVVNERIKSINKIHQDIADWLQVCIPPQSNHLKIAYENVQERRRLEEAYCTGLRRLARRAQPDGSSLG